MFYIKKIFRKKYNLYIIIILSLFSLLFIYLFKYIFVVQKYIEDNIYNQLKNRDIIYYPLDDKIDLNKINSIELIYNDFNNPLFMSNELGLFTTYALFKDYMPKLSTGGYPQNYNEIILPKYIKKNDGSILDLSSYINQEIGFIINDKVEVKFKIIGLYENNLNDSMNCYLNIKFIDKITDKLSDNFDAKRIIVDKQKNTKEVLRILNEHGNAYLYDSGGQREISMYNSIFRMVLICIILNFMFSFIVLFILFFLQIHIEKRELYIKFILGYNNKQLSYNLIEYLFICLFSILISVIVAILINSIYPYLKISNNILLKQMFNKNGLGICITTTIGIFLLLLIIIKICSLIYFRVKYYYKYN